MFVLMLSLDHSLLTDPHGSARARHLSYAERAGTLAIIVRSPRSIPPAPVHASASLTLYPSSSPHPALYPWDALRIGRALTDIDLLVTQDMFTSGLAGVWLRRHLRAPLLVQSHSTIFDNPAWLREKPLRNRALLALGSWVLARADFLRTVNAREAESARAGGFPADRIAALPLGTVSSAFAAPPDAQAVAALRAQLGLTDDHQVILWVGYPVAFKRVPLLLQVFERVAARHPQARLLLVGDLSRSPDDLTALIAQRGLSQRVIMPGAVEHEALPAYYALADLYAHTSSYEGIPRVMMEASSAGLALVAMRTPGVEEIIEDGVNGCLAADGDIEGMANMICGLLDHPGQARALGSSGRKQALSRYSAEGYADQWTDLWRRARELGMRA